MGSPFNFLRTIKLKLRLENDVRFRLSRLSDPRSRVEHFIHRTSERLSFGKYFLYTARALTATGGFNPLIAKLGYCPDAGLQFWAGWLSLAPLMRNVSVDTD